LSVLIIKLLKAIKFINENMISFIGNILCALMMLLDSIP